MRRLALSAAICLLAAASLALKAQGLRGVADGVTPGFDTVAFLKERGFAAAPADASASPAWTTGTRAGCSVSVAEIPPQGWSRDALAAQAAGKRLVFAFGGAFYDALPVARTRFEDYRRRLKRYLGMSSAPLAVRALIVSKDCPQDVLRPQDATLLSQ